MNNPTNSKQDERGILKEDDKEILSRWLALDNKMNTVPRAVESDSGGEITAHAGASKLLSL